MAVRDSFTLLEDVLKIEVYAEWHENFEFYREKLSGLCACFKIAFSFLVV